YQRARELFGSDPESFVVAGVGGIPVLREAGSFALDAAGPTPTGGARPRPGQTATGESGHPYLGKGKLARPGTASSEAHYNNVSFEVLSAYFPQVVRDRLTLPLHDTTSSQGGLDATLRLFAGVDLAKARLVTLDPGVGLGSNRRVMQNDVFTGDATETHQPSITAGPSVGAPLPPGGVSGTGPGWTDSATDGTAADRRTSALSTVKPPPGGAVLVRLPVYWQHAAQVSRRIADSPWATAAQGMLPAVVRKQLGLPGTVAAHTVDDGVHVWVTHDLAKKFDLLPQQVEDASAVVKEETETFMTAAEAWDATARSLRALRGELDEALADVGAARTRLQETQLVETRLRESQAHETRLLEARLEATRQRLDGTGPTRAATDRTTPAAAEVLPAARQPTESGAAPGRIEEGRTDEGRTDEGRTEEADNVSDRTPEVADVPLRRAELAAAAHRLASRQERYAELHQDLADQARDRIGAERRLARAWTFAHDTMGYYGRPEAERVGAEPGAWEPDPVANAVVEGAESPATGTGSASNSATGTAPHPAAPATGRTVAQAERPAAEPAPETAPGYPLPADALASEQTRELTGDPAAGDPTAGGHPDAAEAVHTRTDAWLVETEGPHDPLAGAVDLPEAVARERDKAAAWARQWLAEDARYRAALSETGAAREAVAMADRRIGKTPADNAGRLREAREHQRAAESAYTEARADLHVRHSAVLRARERFLAAEASVRQAAGATPDGPAHQPWYPAADPEGYTRPGSAEPVPEPYSVLTEDAAGKPLSLTGPDGETILDLVEPPSSRPQTDPAREGTAHRSPDADADVRTSFHR
ncbi:hypothetical protein, partial [Streptomyces sp. H27-D2]|uniref:hypothetical protein n=1 Tax=Streptomyces sp. H27-D2 TaxID=3046304 RepID=UPI002DBA8083